MNNPSTRKSRSRDPASHESTSQNPPPSPSSANRVELVLRDDRIIATIAQLNDRIEDRFPESGLSSLCGDLLGVARQAAAKSQELANPIPWIRRTGYGLAVAIILLMVGSIAYAISSLDPSNVGVLEWIAAIESGANEIILLAAAVYFCIRWETRLKRERALAAIHELRSIAHIIDMHQLTKDPERLQRGWADAEHSPKRTLTALQLNRYLDYCTEMLSLTGKIAAMYVQHFDDSEAVAAVSEVEELTTGLSRKIWQKIVMLDQLDTTKR